MSEEHIPPTTPGPYIPITGRFYGAMSEASLAGVRFGAQAPPPTVEPLTPWVGPYGTDFIIFACGSAGNSPNVEDMQSYGTDPQTGSGNLPGIARSAFVNRSLRQGTFVAAAISTFIAGQLTLYVYDDGDLLKYVSYFSEAINKLIIAALPPGPNLGLYLPLAGGTMSGFIDFNTGGPSVRLPNNSYFLGRDTGGVQHGLIGMNSSNFIQVGSTGAPVSYVGASHSFNNNVFLPNSLAVNSFNAAGTASYALAFIYSDNNLYFGPGPASSYYRAAAGGNHYFNSAIVLPNNVFLWGTATSGSNFQVAGIASDNVTYLGDGTHAVTIRAPNLNITGTTWHQSNVVVPNNAWYYGTIASGSPYNILGIRSDNVCQVGQAGLTTNYAGASNVFNNGLYCYNNIGFAGGASVTLNNNAYYYGADTGGTQWALIGMGSDNQVYIAVNGNHNVVIEGNVYLGASINIPGNCSVGSWLYAGGVQSWGDVHANGSLYVGGIQLYNNGGWFYTGSPILSGSTIQGAYLYSSGDIRAAGALWADGIPMFNQGSGYLQISATPYLPYGLLTANMHSLGNINVDGSAVINGCIFVGGLQLCQSEGYWDFRAGMIVYGNSWWPNSMSHAFGIWGQGCQVSSGDDFFCWGGFYAGGDFRNHGFGAASGNDTGQGPWISLLSSNAAKYGSFWNDYSDERLKKNIEPYQRGLADVRRLEPRVYEYNGAFDMLLDYERHVGLIAQEVKAVIPEMVKDQYETSHTLDEPIMALDVAPLFYAMLNSIKELASRVEALEAGRA
jgi:hypothetical protein